MKHADSERGMRIPALVLIFALIPAILTGQTIWVDRPDNGYASVEILKPSFKHDDENLPMYAFMVSLHLPVSDSLRLVFDLPLAYAAYYKYNYDYPTYTLSKSRRSEFAPGNPYFGIEGPADAGLSWEIGVRLPLASEKKTYALSVGYLSDYDRMEAFGRELLPLQLSLNIRRMDASGLNARLRFGPDFWVYTASDRSDDRFELLMHYSGQVGFEGKGLAVLAGITGRLIVTEGDLNIGERTFHQLGISAGVNLGRFRPALFARFPLDKDLSEILENVIGLTCSARTD